MSKQRPVVAVLVGSLRKGSFNKQLAHALEKIAGDRPEFRHIRIDDLPLYNQDFDGDYPAVCKRLKDEIKACDAVLFVTPEYNRSIPGVLKNAIDVGSRPSGQSSFKTKPIGIVANSPGPLGGMAAAMNLKQSLPGFCGPILQQPEIYLNGVGDAFDDKGNLVKESLQKVLQQYIDAFAAHVARHKA